MAKYYSKNELYPEVEYCKIQLENPNVKPQNETDMKQMKETETNIYNEIRKKTNIIEKQHYHLHFDEKPSRNNE